MTASLSSFGLSLCLVTVAVASSASATRHQATFDGFANGVLLEAKGPGYGQLLDAPFGHRVVDGFIDQATRQVAAAGGTPVRWVFAEQVVADVARAAFQENGLNIEVTTAAAP
jgi:hypothetical protein